MSVVITRIQPGDPRRPRNLEDHLWIRWPRLFRGGAHLIALLPARAKLRRALAARGVAAGFAAANRLDLELIRIRYAPDVEHEAASDLQALIGSSSAGSQGPGQVVQMFIDAAQTWDRWVFTPEWVLDLGDRFVVVGGFRGSGAIGGVEVTAEFGVVCRHRGGIIVGQQDYMHWHDALNAAGLDAETIEPRIRA